MNRLRAALRPLIWPLVWSVLAATAAMALSFALRAAFQVRTLPERMMEWLLLYVPIDAFASGIQSLGPQAKVLALYGSAAVMTAALVGLGVLSLWRRWSPPAVLGMAAALFLVAMGGLIPLTGGGFFGAALPQHPLLVNAVYACIALGYGTVLLLGRALGIGAVRATSGATVGVVGTAATPATVVTVDGRGISPSLAQSSPLGPYGSRRAVAFSAAGTGVAYLAALRQASIGGGAAGSNLPLANASIGTYSSSHSIMRSGSVRTWKAARRANESAIAAVAASTLHTSGQIRGLSAARSRFMICPFPTARPRRPQRGWRTCQPRFQ